MQATAKSVWGLSVMLQLAVCIAATSAPDAAAAEVTPLQTNTALPKYQLKVGQELIYQLSKQQSFSSADAAAQKKSGVPRDHMEWQVIVTDKNEDGSWRLLIRTNIVFKNNDGSERARRQSLGYCDLQSDGSYALDEQTAINKRLIPYELFCRLPESMTALRAGWRYKVPTMDFDLQLHAEDRSGSVLRIAGIEKSIYEEVHHWEEIRIYDFDRDRGLVTSITDEFKDLSANELKSRRVVKLISVASHDSEWLASFRGDAERYLLDFRKWLDLVYAGTRTHTVDECRAARTQARAVLDAGRKQAKSELVQECYDVELRQHDEDDRDEIKMAENRNRFFDLAPSFATDWQAKRLDGGTFRLADLRGKPVVLFFWGTSCEYCVKMGPQLKQLADEFKDKGAVVLGMLARQEGVPQDEEDAQAKFLIARAFQGFDHLDGSEIEKLYRLAELGLEHPSLVVLDQAGQPREVQLGYSPDTVRRMQTVLSKLLQQTKKPG
jgi:peroxiredoxin